MTKRSTNLNRAHKSARLSLRNMAETMRYFGMSDDEIRASLERVITGKTLDKRADSRAAEQSEAHAAHSDAENV